MERLLFITLLTIFSFASKAQILKERRVYYLDCSYSMEQNGIWNLVRDKLKDAIDNVNDETTELYVCPYAYDRASSVQVYHDLATGNGKKRLKSIIDGLRMSKSTKTYHEMPLRDFYTQRVSSNRINYVFFMTDGVSDHLAEDKNHDPFPNELSTWYSRYKNKHVYGFYVMLHESAKSYKAALNVIGSKEKQRSHHLWAIESANVNINLIRLSTNAVFNARTENYFEIPIYGIYKGLTINAKFPDSSKFKVEKSSIQNGKLRIYVKVDGNVHSLPVKQTIPMNLSMGNSGEYDFLVTEFINVLCLSKRERTLKLSVL